VTSERRVFRVRGTVQGVGFRPFVYRAAAELGLAGEVWNDPDGVVIDAEGDAAALDALERRLRDAPPPRALVESVTWEARPSEGRGAFRIVESEARAPTSARVSADLATCAACLAELFDPGDRRFRYPFINCTDCGPRYTIVLEVPYDRRTTTMARFVMCDACAAEYHDPASRRFHAQPNACPACGPRVFLASGEAADPIGETAHALRGGAIAAVKGLGGFHLACDARSERAVDLLRERKRRPDKPFAVMFSDLASVGEELALDATSAAALSGARRPIVLLPKRGRGTLAEGVAPRLDVIGAFLPYTPVHHLLLRAFGGPLVMTSGNLSEEPIASDNDDARERLSGIADVFLLHDRDIAMRTDDSVVQVVLGEERVMRRARGHVPEAIELGLPDGPDVLAVGADLKSTLAVTAGSAAILSQHIGDLESLESQLFFTEVGERLQRLFRTRPAFVAHDLHPAYHSTALAKRTGLPAIAVQHHHAHVASCLAENGRRDPVIGVAWDGTGYGPDASVWGGEILVADLRAFTRKGRIRPVPLAGGDAAVKEPWRMAVAHLREAGLATSRVAHPRRALLEAMIQKGVSTVPTSSAGRLFDAIASLAGIRDAVSYEGQAAMELEALSRAEDERAYPLPVTLGAGGFLEIDPRPLVAGVVADVDARVPVSAIGGRFHLALADAIGEACERVRDGTSLGAVALSGGCFQSRLLTELVHARLARAGFEVLLHARVPPNDGGIALGQAAVAAWSVRKITS
jgi:hydrogenase maturation protein HypF